MAEPLSSEEFGRLLDTDDPFRLAIRGHTALDELVKAGLEDALGPGRLNVNPATRLDIANRLGLLSEIGRQGMRALGEFRNWYAHRVGDSPPPDKMRNLVAALKHPDGTMILGDLEPKARSGTDEQALRIVLIALRLEIEASIEAWRGVQETQALALERRRAQRRLTPEQIRQLVLEQVEGDQLELEQVEDEAPKGEEDA